VAAYLAECVPFVSQNLVVLSAACLVVHAAPRDQKQMKGGLKALKGRIGRQQPQGPVVPRLAATKEQALLVGGYACSQADVFSIAFGRQLPTVTVWVGHQEGKACTACPKRYMLKPASGVPKHDIKHNLYHSHMRRMARLPESAVALTRALLNHQLELAYCRCLMCHHGNGAARQISHTPPHRHGLRTQCGRYLQNGQFGPCWAGPVCCCCCGRLAAAVHSA
jgi:hypothetical protein